MKYMPTRNKTAGKELKLHLTEAARDWCTKDRKAHPYHREISRIRDWQVWKLLGWKSCKMSVRKARRKQNDLKTLFFFTEQRSQELGSIWKDIKAMVISTVKYPSRSPGYEHRIL